ncbi:hypothetical protein J2129_000253 [Methanofollis sp. W23]|uniref:hypothetical protein n=1 Tax=Methanofollis sp. W23 TaxID=2817849 RepID=UPI001AE7F4EA|nr:hypothetical protein [Methanofollis sp. W23]MBP2144799.1 hypothetical protein [Methanofollis sp. W23]
MIRLDRFLLIILGITLVAGVVAVITGPHLIPDRQAENITPVDIGGPGWACVLRDIDDPVTTEEMNDRIDLAVSDYRDIGGRVASEMYFGNSTDPDGVGTLAFGFVIDKDGVPGTYTGSGNRGAVGTIHEMARKWFSRHFTPRCPHMVPPFRIEDCDGLPLIDLAGIPVLEEEGETALRTNISYIARIAMQDKTARELLMSGGTIEGVAKSIHHPKTLGETTDTLCETYPALRITGSGVTLDVMVDETAGTVVGSTVKVPSGAEVRTLDNPTEICHGDEVPLAFATSDTL